VLPYATLEPIRDQLMQSFMGEKLGRDSTWEEHFATEAWQADMRAQVVLHEMQMPLKRILAMEVGDTIPFDVRADTPAFLRCGDWTLTEGRIGRLDDKMAIQVTKPLRRSKTNLAAFESGTKGPAET
jgi:flagellar motor switch protein FliM